MRLRVKLKQRRIAKQGNGDEAEEDRVSEEEPVEREPPSSDTQDTLHETDSEFVPSDAELHSNKINNSSTSESVTTSGTENSEEAAETLESLSEQHVLY
jgi:hypothetical protein